MSEQRPEVMSWGKIVGIMIAVGLVAGLTLGLVRQAFGLQGGTAGVGAAIGVVGAGLVMRRRAAQRRQH